MISVYFNDEEIGGIKIIRRNLDPKYSTLESETEIPVEGRFEKADKLMMKITHEDVLTSSTVERGIVYFDNDIDIKQTDELEIQDIRYKVIKIEHMNDFSRNFVKVTLQ